MGSRVWRGTVAAALFAGAIMFIYGAIAVPAHGLASNARMELGPESASAPVSVTVWLKMHNEAAADALLQQMNDANSPNYHHWLTQAQYKAQFAPTAADALAVQKYLASFHLNVKSVEANNHFVMAEGQIGDAQRAFNTRVNRVLVNGQIHRQTTSVPRPAGPTDALVAAVQGLGTMQYRANVSVPKEPETGTPYKGVSVSSAPNGLFFSADCLRGVQTVTFTTNGGPPKATYTGNRYGANITNTNPPNLPPCGYDAAEMQTAYGLNSVYKQGLRGAGQTIVIVDAYGSNTILQDANLFSQLNGLPKLVPGKNFQIIQPTGPVTCTATNGCISGNWQYETTLDVEWAHAMAPDANIILVEAADNGSSLDLSNLYAVENQLGSVISNSFGIPEILLVEYYPSQLVVENQIAKTAALLGISLNVSSGDAGDDLALDTADFGIPLTSVDALADSPYVTAVGGTSTFLNSQNQIKLQTGWGLNFVRIANPIPNPPTIPPLFFGFQGGSGGGTSVYFAKPAFQNGLSGAYRKVPDISMNADPQTGNEVIVTPDSVPGHPQQVSVFGGTSLSCPMFSAVWAIANQAALAKGAVSLLGQAAPILYQMGYGPITDVNVPASARQHNVTGVIYNPPNPPQYYSANALAEPQPPAQNQYISALYQSPVSTRWDVFTFGTDSSLATGPGWDNVTGLGTPNGSAFINSALAHAKY